MGATPHVPLAMAGRFKEHVGENQYFQTLANVTVLGVNIQKWMFRAITTFESLGVSDGPMFRVVFSGRGAKVKRCAIGDLNPAFHALLKQVQDSWPNVIPASVDASRRNTTLPDPNAEESLPMLRTSASQRKSSKRTTVGGSMKGQEA